jgi:hypothetical protein
MQKLIGSVVVFGLVVSGCGFRPQQLYLNNFEQNTDGKVPEEMLVLDGGFGVVNVEGNKVLELPGSPLETYGALFGPAQSSNVTVQARIQGTGQGRRFPVFGVGLNGVAGYRLRVSPAKKAVELCKGDDAVASAGFAWKSGTWTLFRLELVQAKGGGLMVRGKAWTEGEKEPSWMIEHTAEGNLPAGRSSVWGSPYAGTPIRFDDLRILTAAPPK